MTRKKNTRKMKPQKKTTYKLETVFDCPYCNHSKCVEIKMYSISIETSPLGSTRNRLAT